MVVINGTICLYNPLTHTNNSLTLTQHITSSTRDKTYNHSQITKHIKLYKHKYIKVENIYIPPLDATSSHFVTLDIYITNYHPNTAIHTHM